MPIRTRRWNDPSQPDDGTRLLITRYRPRGVSKADETWDEWLPELGPSRELHALVYAKMGHGIPWSTYLQRYRTEMQAQNDLIRRLAKRVVGGEILTLLCSSACDRESRCHRSILRDLIEREVAGMGGRPERL
jgi:uncharacterized protein YeaO (DUF488 family)